MGAKYDRELVDEIARELIEKHAITHEVHGTTREDGRAGPDVLYRAVAIMVQNRVGGLKPETIGRIAATGRAQSTEYGGTTSLYQAYGGPYLSTRKSGMDLLIRIATIAIVARMWDILDADFRERRERKHQERVERLMMANSPPHD